MYICNEESNETIKNESKSELRVSYDRFRTNSALVKARAVDSRFSASNENISREQCTRDPTFLINGVNRSRLNAARETLNDGRDDNLFR